MGLAYLVVTGGKGRFAETVGRIPRYSRVLVLDWSLYDERPNLPRMWNQGLARLFEAERFDMVLVLDEDVVIRNSTGPEFEKALRNAARVSPQPLLVTGYNLRRQLGEPYAFARLAAAGCHHGPRLDFSCFAMTYDALRVVEQRQFEESFETAYYAGHDLARRLKVRGYGSYCFAPIWHYGETDDREEFDRQVLRDEARYRARWGGPIGHEQTMRPGLTRLSAVSA